MQTQKPVFIGIDVSKLHFDVALMVVKDRQKEAIITQRFANSADGLTLFRNLLKPILRQELSCL